MTGSRSEFTLRLPLDICERVEKAAKRCKLSRNAYIVYLLATVPDNFLMNQKIESLERRISELEETVKKGD